LYQPKKAEKLKSFEEKFTSANYENSTSRLQQVRDEMAEALWQIALLVEEGDLASALERLRRHARRDPHLRELHALS
jgi:guanylate kinase